MIRMMLIVLFALAVACSGDAADPDQTDDPDADSDASDADAGSNGDAAASDADTDNGDGCVCDDADSPCCDGCDAVSVGDECDDGLDCTIGTVCTAGGECADPEGSPCDDQIDHPDCQTATCDEIEGCSYEPIREDLGCETDSIVPDSGQCTGGECVGIPCECDDESDPCCEDCLAVGEGADCDDGDDSTVDETCQAGECIGVELECDPGDGECCEEPGFFVEEGTKCDDDVVDSYRECDGQLSYYRVYEYPACTGDSAECSEESVTEEQGPTHDCGYDEQCHPDSGACY